MTDSDHHFIKKVVADGMNPGKAYNEVYQPEIKQGSGQKAKALLKDPEIKEGVKEACYNSGITIRRLNQRLKDKLTAQKAVVVGKDSRIEMVDDHAAQLEAIKTGYKLLGALKEQDVVIDNRQVTFNGDINQLLKVMQEMKELKRQSAEDVTGEVV